MIKIKKILKKINSGISPFLEEGSESLLSRMLKKKSLEATNNLEHVKNSKYVIVCIGTPIDHTLSPELKNF